MLRIYVIGLLILIIAILANAAALKLGIRTWYDFIEMLQVRGTSAFEALSIVDYLWLFVAYPLVLGLGYLIGDGVYSLIN